MCEDDDAIAVACLDLNYTISFKKSSKKVKDERSDKTEAVVLSALEDQEKKSEELNRSKTCWLSWASHIGVHYIYLYVG